MARRLGTIDLWQRNADIAYARRDEQFTTIKDDLKNIKGTISRIMWLIITALVVAVMAFIIRGGFKVPSRARPVSGARKSKCAAL